MTISKHAISAVVEGVEYEAVPAYDIEHPEEVAYSKADWGTFEGWTVTTPGGGSYGTGSEYHSPETSFELVSNDEGVIEAKRTVTGLTIGRSYTLSAWALPGAGTGFIANSTVGVTGLGFGEGDQSVEWFELTYIFTATATSHEIVLQALSLFGGSTAFWDDITLTADAYSEHVPAVIATSYPLNIIEGELGMDDGWSPYIQGELKCYAPPAAALDLIDPRDDLRVTVTVSKEYGDWNTAQDEDQERTFDLLLRARTVDHNEGTMTVIVESDEGLLQDFGLVAMEAERVYGVSVKDAVNYALGKIGAELEAGASDADVESDVDEPVVTNLALNPSFESNVTNWIDDSVRNMSRRTDGGNPAGAAYGRCTFAATSAGSGPFHNVTWAVTPSTTYSGSVWVRSSKSQRVSLNLQFVNSAGTQIGAKLGDQVVLAAGVWTKLTVTGTTTSATVKMGAYVYNASGTGFSNWVSGDYMDIDGLIVVEGSEVPEFFDGSTPDTGFIEYAWTGTANNSQSTRTYLPNSDAMVWSPGTTAWDFLEPLFNSVGLRLYCNENRQWLLEPSGTLKDDQLNIAAEFNATEASDTISRFENWYDSVVIRYTGNRDQNGQKYTTYDVAGAPGTKVLTVEYDRPTPGLGAAQAILDRALGKGRVLSLSAISDYRGTPGMSLVATLPASPIQTGVVSSVAWKFPDGTMTIGSRALADTPESAWALAPDGVGWVDVPTGTDWSEYDPDAL